MSQNEIWEDEDWFPEETKNPVKQTPCNLEEKNSVALASNRTEFVSGNETKDRYASCQKAEETHIMNKQIPAILDPRNGYALIKIINQLDPSSFVKLAKTCRSMHDFCFNLKDIKITYDVGGVWFDYEYGCDCGYVLKFECLHLRARKVLESAKARRRIQDLYPFVFSINTFFFAWHPLDERGIAIVRWLLDDLPMQKISALSGTLYPDLDSWDSFFRFVEDFHVESVVFDDNDHDYRILEEVTRRLVTNGLKKLFCASGLHMEDQTPMLEATVPILELWGMKLSDEMYDALVLKCIHSTLNIDWTFRIHHRNSPFELHDRGLYKTFPFNYDGPIPEERPIVFVKEYDSLHFCILRKDNTIFRVVPNYEFYYRFNVSNNPNDWPPCLRWVGIPIDLRKTLSFPPFRSPSSFA